MHKEKPLLSFVATIDKYDYTKYIYTVIYYPAEITDTLTFVKSRLRAKILVDGLLLDVALIPDTVGSKQTMHLCEADDYLKGQRIWYTILAKKYLKRLNKKLGDSITVTIIETY